jgi:hypothetical protein
MPRSRKLLVVALVGAAFAGAVWFAGRSSAPEAVMSCPGVEARKFTDMPSCMAELRELCWCWREGGVQ